MKVTYAVIKTGEHWTVFEDGVPIERRSYKPDAVEVGHLLTVASRAAGGTATLLVQDGASQLETWNFDRVDRDLQGIFVTERRRRNALSSPGEAASSIPTAPSAHV